MDKSPDAFRTISEVADWLGTPAHVLRFWESRFSQVKPVKRAGGRRYYRPADMILLGGIKKLLHDDGMTIRGVQKLLREHGVRYVSSMSQQLDGVDPVTPLRESVGPIPSAPMAVDVPTGAFDEQPAEPEENVVAFSRSQPAPAKAPVTNAPASKDVAQVPFDFDAAPETDSNKGATPSHPDAADAAPAPEPISETAPASAPTVSADVPKTEPDVLIPADPEDDATGLSVTAGVVGQFDQDALSTADPKVIQDLFNRADALQARLTQS